MRGPPNEIDSPAGAGGESPTAAGPDVAIGSVLMRLLAGRFTPTSQPGEARSAKMRFVSHKAEAARIIASVSGGKATR
jgi:hypothetical protein